jgi:formate-dependent nitrite reductase membrane component NrfD
MFAVVWHYWIAVVLFILAVVPATVMMIVMYLRKTQAPKYNNTIKE